MATIIGKRIEIAIPAMGLAFKFVETIDFEVSPVFPMSPFFRFFQLSLYLLHVPWSLTSTCFLSLLASSYPSRMWCQTLLVLLC